MRNGNRVGGTSFIMRSRKKQVMIMTRLRRQQTTCMHFRNAGNLWQRDRR